ncbi:MAG: hypothetical protein ACRDJW_18740 [Thermomicrobiales bacterium]
MAFADAVFDGRAFLDGVEAIRIEDLALLPALLDAHGQVPLVVADFDAVFAACRPDVLVDARMRKHSQPEQQRGLAPLTIGLGPNFVAGRTADLAIETSWDALGDVIEHGATRPLAGEPRALAGHRRDRYVYAPHPGVFRTDCEIGEAVRPGETIADIDGTPLTVQLAGVLRGLTRNGVPVERGTKVIEIDPRGTDAVVAGIAERPARIADGVLRVLALWSERRDGPVRLAAGGESGQEAPPVSKSRAY